MISKLATLKPLTKSSSFSSALSSSAFASSDLHQKRMHISELLTNCLAQLTGLVKLLEEQGDAGRAKFIDYVAVVFQTLRQISCAASVK